MKICEIQKLLNAELLTCNVDIDKDVRSACGSDMMSDVLAYVKDQAVLLTGLVNMQVIRTAEMMDMVCVVFVRNKAPSDDILLLAESKNIVVMKTEERMFDACGILYSAGLRKGE